MEIKVISNDSFVNDKRLDNKHLSNISWVNSRPSEDLHTLDSNMVRSLDLPVNEFPSVVLFIESTILEREIITTMRNHVMWAQTSRVQNILQFEYPHWIEDKTSYYFENIRLKMKKISESTRQDNYRKFLPVMSLTKYSIRASARDLMHIASYFEFLSSKIKMKHLLPMFSTSVFKIYKVLDEMGFGGAKKIKKEKCKKILKPILNFDSGKIGSTIVISAHMPLYLRAQLVRHRNITVRDNLEELMSSELVLKASIDQQMEIQISGHEEDILEVVKKRSCWIAQHNLWSPMLNKIDEIIPTDRSILPCSDGNCPYEKDDSLRYTDKDPNAPCPVRAVIENITPSKKIIEEMRGQLASDNRPLFWHNVINTIDVS
jgi:hypothetical protein